MQYAEAGRFMHWRLWIPDRRVQAGRWQGVAAAEEKSPDFLVISAGWG